MHIVMRRFINGHAKYELFTVGTKSSQYPTSEYSSKNFLVVLRTGDLA